MANAPGDRFSRPSRALLRDFTRVLTALAGTTEEEMDRGRWTKRVNAGGREVDVTLSLPHVVDPEAARSGCPPDQRDFRGGERLHADIGRFLASHEFADMDEADEALRREFAGDGATGARPAPSTPLERAQDLAYEAFESIGRQRVILAPTPYDREWSSRSGQSLPE